MTDQGDDDNTVYSDKSALVWAVNNVYVLVQSPFEALASERMPDLVLSYVFMRHAEAHLSSQDTPLDRS
jgi:hypothetical protein